MRQAVFLLVCLCSSVAMAQSLSPEIPNELRSVPHTAEGTAIVDPVAELFPITNEASPCLPLTVAQPFMEQASCAAPRPRQGGWFGDVGFYVLTPKWSNGNPAYATITFEDGPGPLIISQPNQVDFSHNPQFAPLLQLGYMGRCGLGARARWWTLSSTDTLVYQGNTNEVLQFPDMLGTGQYLNYLSLSVPQFSTDGQLFTHRLSMNVLDLEGVWENQLERTSLLWSAGVRYAYIGQSYSLLGPNTVPSELFGQGFSGAGPTASLQATRRIGHTHFSLFGLGRGSLLCGTSNQQSGLGQEADASPFDRTIVSQAFRPVGELELGSSWSHCRGRFEFFAESAFVGMVWFDAGNAANSGAIQTPNPLLVLVNPSIDPSMVSLANSGSNDANQDLGLVGLRFSTGIRF